MELIELSAKTRENKGKGAARKLRNTNGIPAIMYGAKTDPVMLSLETVELDRIIRENGTSGLFFSLRIEGGSERIVMLKDLQMDTFGLKYLHADLQEIDMDTMVTVTVPVETEGVSAGVKEGGILQVIRRELDVLCKPANTPEAIVLDISELNIGDAIHVEDIDLGDDVEIPYEVNFTVITIIPPTASEEEETEEEVLDELGEEEAAEAPADEE
ncbi:50S ribosomal protein L25 [Desulfospira joergensenii]|uniref:50S ribosomal protein L25 n=1 Tax=Desulfospira joergensenii TaxID=53329 RepID=UPI0003B683DF|nr:50S ribosomal protein L25 [Desulfospira joergensenii]